MQNTDDPAYQNQQSTEQGAHDDRIVQGVADGHKPIIGHHSQEEVVQLCTQHKKKYLSDAAFIADSLALGLGVPQHLWDGGGCDTEVYKGQVGEEGVHWGVEVGV